MRLGRGSRIIGPGIEEAPLRGLAVIADDDADIAPAAPAKREAAQRAGLETDQQSEQQADAMLDRARRAEHVQRRSAARPTTSA